MEFDKSRVYSAVDADELKVGSIVVVADTLRDLKDKVESCEYETKLCDIGDDDNIYRFHIDGKFGNGLFALAYLVSEPGKLKWTDLKIGDIICCDAVTAMVTAIDSEENDCHIFAGGVWLDDVDLKHWEKVNEHK